MANTREMRVRLSLEASRFQSGLKDAMQSITDFKSKAMAMGQVVLKAGKAFVNFGVTAVKWFGNTLKTVASVSAKIGTAIGGISLAAIKTAADFQALDSMFKSTFGNLADEATKSMSKIAKETGIATGRLKQGFTDVFMQLKGSGIEANKALELTNKGMRLAADAAAAYNIPLEDAVTKIRSFIRGNTEAGDAIGLFTSESQRNSAAVEKYGKKWQELTEAQKQNLMLDISEKIYKESGAMGQAMREADGLENVLGNLKFTLKDFLSSLGKNMLEPAINSMKDFSIALMDTQQILENQGLSAAIEHMTKFIADKISGLANQIPSLMTNAISGINAFINNSLPSLMAAGGQIVQSISQGITSNQSQITSGISSLIGQIANWINENMPAIEAAGKSIIDAIKNGISNNKDAIGEAVYNVTKTAVALFVEYKYMIFEAGTQVGGEFIKGVWEGIWQGGQSYKPQNDNNFVPTKEDALQKGLEYGTAWVSSAGQVFGEKGPSLTDSLFSGETYTKIQVSGAESGYAYIDGIKTKISELSPEMQTVVNNLLKNQEGATQSGLETGKAHTDGAKAGITEGKEGVKAASKQVSTESAAAMLEELSKLKPETYQKMLDAAQAVRQSATDMYNGAKYSFSQLGKAAKEAMTEMYKGVGTSMYMTAQKVRQEASNMYNGAKTSFVNLCNVGKNQFSNLYNGASNSIRSLSHAVQGNMNTIRSSINIRSAVNGAISDFNRLRSSLSRPISARVNISRVTTVSTVSKPARMHSFAAIPFALSSATSGAAMSSGKSENSTQNMTTIIKLDSKEIARQTAPYMDGALNTMTARRNRLGGAF